jgi:hypothetical protein
MSGKNFILDTNVIIYLSQEKMRLTDFSSKGDRLCISIDCHRKTVQYRQSDYWPCGGFGTKEIDD